MVKIKILVVEDENIEALDIKRTLESFGYEVPYVASRGEEAIVAAKNILPDLILMDIILHGKINGIEAASQIKELNIPLIFLTAHSDDGAVEKAKTSDPYGYLVKPYDPVDLKNTVEFALYKHEMDEKLKKSEKKYRSIVENLQDAFIRTDIHGKIIMANPSAASMFKYNTPEEMIGKSTFTMYRYPETRTFMTNKLEKYGQIEGYEVEGLKTDGTIFWLSVNSQPYTDNGKIMGVESFLRDVTVNKCNEKKINKLYRLYATLSQINQAVVRINDTKSLFKTVCEVCVKFGKFKMAWIGMIDEKTGKILPVEHYGYEEGYLDNVNININDPEVNPSFKALQNGKFVLIRNIETEMKSKWVKKALKRDYKSMALIPIKLEGKIIAILYIYSSEVNFFTDEELDLIKEIAIDLSFAVTTIKSKKERELLGKALIESEESYRELVDNSIVAIYKTNLKGDIIFANQAMANFFDYESNKELYKTNVVKLYSDPLDRKKLIKELEIKGILDNYEVEMISKTGRSINILLSANLNKNIISGMMMDITKRKNFERELKNSENKFHALVENASDALFVHDFDGKIVDVNRKACESLGYTREELLQKNVVDIEQDFDLEKAKVEWKKIKAGVPHTIYGHHKRKDGTTFPIEVSFAIVEIDGKSLVMRLDRDISKRIEAGKELKESEEKYRSIFDYSMVAITLTTPDGRTVDANHAAEQLFGYTKEEFIKLSREELIDPKDKNRLKIFLENRDRNGFYRGELNFIKKDGTIFPTEILSTKFYDKQGNERAMAQIMDITPRKLSEKQLKDSENRYRKVGRLISDFAYSCIKNEEGIYVIEWITDSFYNITGFNKQDVDEHGNCWMFTVHPEDELIAETHLNTLKPGNKDVKNFRIVQKNGEILWIENHLECVEDEEGKLRIYGAAKDITEIERAVSDMKLSEEKFRAIINNSTDIIRILDVYGKIIFESPSSERILGYPEGALLGKSPMEYIHPDDRELVKTDLEAVFQNTNPGTPTEFRIKKVDGSYLAVESISQNMFNVPSVAGIVVTTHPIEERKNMENAIKSSLREKEILLKEIHHRVKNNMQIISSLLNLQKEYVDDYEAINVLQESQNRVKTMSIIHEKLYQSDNLTHINIKEYVEKLINDLFFSYAVTNITPVLDIKKIKLNIETALPCGLIISELVSNSLKYAFPEDTTGKLNVSMKKIEDKFELIICDNGVGLPKDLDFKNTESLGLQLVNNLVGQLDGQIEVNNSLGTKFRITFKELQYKSRI